MYQLFFKILNYIFFYIGWGICLHQASKGNPYAGPLVVGGILIVHLATIKNLLAEFFIILTVAIIGTLIDSIYSATGMILYHAGYHSFPWLAPLWLTSVWALYAMCLNYSLSWLLGHDLIAGILGGTSAAICYSAAEEIGAIEIFVPRISLLVFIGFLWFFIFPISLRYSNWILLKCAKEKRSLS